MRSPAARTLEAVPNPKVVVAIGDCAAGCGVFAGTSGVGAGAGVELDATIIVPGCPPTPSMIKDGLLQAAQALSDLVNPTRGSDIDRTKNGCR
jgi:Ni,Fe-hydrogenase III small subunit